MSSKVLMEFEQSGAEQAKTAFASEKSGSEGLAALADASSHPVAHHACAQAQQSLQTDLSHVTKQVEFAQHEVMQHMSNLQSPAQTDQHLSAPYSTPSPCSKAESIQISQNERGPGAPSAEIVQLSQNERVQKTQDGQSNQVVPSSQSENAPGGQSAQAVESFQGYGTFSDIKVQSERAEGMAEAKLIAETVSAENVSTENTDTFAATASADTYSAVDAAVNAGNAGVAGAAANVGVKQDENQAYALGHGAKLEQAYQGRPEYIQPYTQPQNWQDGVLGALGPLSAGQSDAGMAPKSGFKAAVGGMKCSHMPCFFLFDYASDKYLLDDGSCRLLGLTYTGDWIPGSFIESQITILEDEKFFNVLFTCDAGDQIVQSVRVNHGEYEGDLLYMSGSVVQRDDTGIAIIVAGYFSRIQVNFTDYLSKIKNQSSAFDLDVSTGEIHYGPAYKELLGYKSQDHLPQTLSEFERTLVHKDDLPVFRRINDIIDNPRAGYYYEAIFRLQHKGGYYLWCIDRGLVVERNGNGKATRIIGTTTDIDILRSNFERLKRSIYQDPLTGLHNRLYLNTRYKYFTMEESQPLSLVYADISGLKLINDYLGHSKGDTLVRLAAQILQNDVYLDHEVVRLSGDEFLLIFTSCSAVECKLFINKFTVQLNERNRCQEFPVPIFFGFGIATLYEIGEDDTFARCEARADVRLQEYKTAHHDYIYAALRAFLENTLGQRIDLTDKRRLEYLKEANRQNQPNQTSLQETKGQANFNAQASADAQANATESVNAATNANASAESKVQARDALQDNPRWLDQDAWDVSSAQAHFKQDLSAAVETARGGKHVTDLSANQSNPMANDELSVSGQTNSVELPITDLATPASQSHASINDELIVSGQAASKAHSGADVDAYITALGSKSADGNTADGGTEIGKAVGDEGNPGRLNEAKSSRNESYSSVQTLDQLSAPVSKTGALSSVTDSGSAVQAQVSAAPISDSVIAGSSLVAAASGSALGSDVSSASEACAAPESVENNVQNQGRGELSVSHADSLVLDSQANGAPSWTELIADGKDALQVKDVATEQMSPEAVKAAEQNVLLENEFANRTIRNLPQDLSAYSNIQTSEDKAIDPEVVTALDLDITGEAPAEVSAQWLPAPVLDDRESFKHLPEMLERALENNMQPARLGYTALAEGVTDLTEGGADDVATARAAGNESTNDGVQVKAQVNAKVGTEESTSSNRAIQANADMVSAFPIEVPSTQGSLTHIEYEGQIASQVSDAKVTDAQAADDAYKASLRVVDLAKNGTLVSVDNAEQYEYRDDEGVMSALIDLNTRNDELELTEDQEYNLGSNLNSRTVDQGILALSEDYVLDSLNFEKQQVMPRASIANNQVVGEKSEGRVEDSISAQEGLDQAAIPYGAAQVSGYVSGLVADTVLRSDLASVSHPDSGTVMGSVSGASANVIADAKANASVSVSADDRACAHVGDELGIHDKAPLGLDYSTGLVTGLSNEYGAHENGTKQVICHGNDHCAQAVCGGSVQMGSIGESGRVGVATTIDVVNGKGAVTGDVLHGTGSSNNAVVEEKSSAGLAKLDSGSDVLNSGEFGSALENVKSVYQDERANAESSESVESDKSAENAKQAENGGVAKLAEQGKLSDGDASGHGAGTANLVLGYWYFRGEDKSFLLDKQSSKYFGLDYSNEWHPEQEILDRISTLNVERYHKIMNSLEMGSIIFEDLKLTTAPWQNKLFVINGSVLSRFPDSLVRYAVGYLTQVENSFSELIAHEIAGDGFFTWDSRSNCLHFSSASRHMRGTGENDFNCSFYEWIREIVHPDDVEIVEVEHNIFLSPNYGDNFEFCVRLRQRIGNYIWSISRGIVLQRDENGRASSIIGTLSNINLVRDNFENIKQLLYTDTLTGLHNRAYFQNHMAAWQDEELQPVSVIYADITGLKITNDVLGHADGDTLILAVTDTLTNVLDDNCDIMRLSGDEFLVIMPHCDRQQSQERVDEVLDYLHEHNKQPNVMPIFIGLGRATMGEVPMDTLHACIERADVRMQNFKDANRTECYRILQQYLEKRKGRPVSMRDGRRLDYFSKEERDKAHQQMRASKAPY